MKCETLNLKEIYPFLGGDGRDAVLDCYLPYNMPEMHREAQKRKTLLICPGGGYSFVSEREGEPIAVHFLAAGYNVFVLHYSVDVHRFPAQICEVAAAVELIRARADEWNCDAERLALLGFSAGGHLAAHYATAFDCAAVRAFFPASRNVNAVLLGYPVITAETGVTHAGSFEHLCGHFPLTADEEAQFSCDRLVRDDTPPTFLWHTAADKTVPVANSLRYAAALAAHGVPFELHVYPFGWHGLSTADAETAANPLPKNIQPVHGWLADAVRFLGDVLA